MGQALYRKYRSKKLSEIVGQEHITGTLERALRTGKLSHAYLFTGPRGVGKTSIARILAHEINNLPYTDESTHLDIIEIDAASNRRIDEIRDLREKVHIAPTSAKFKVYIIDEVHMLTKEAFNALLKTLEEPPAHVVFILATTELHKLPETIISRTQRFTFKAIEPAEAAAHLRTIAKEEGIEIDDEALRLLAIHGRGSFRDSISLLDQVSSGGARVTGIEVQKLIGVGADSHIDDLEAVVENGSPTDIVRVLDLLVSEGIGPAQIAKQLASRLRQRILAGEATTITTSLLRELLAVQQAQDPYAQLEVVLFEAHFKDSAPTNASLSSRIETTPDVLESIDMRLDPAKQPESAVPEPKADTRQADAPLPPEPSQKIMSGDPADWWQEVLQHIKSMNNTLYGVLRMAETAVEGETLHLKFGFGFHKKKADDAATQAKIRKAIEVVTGKTYTINTIHDKNSNSIDSGQQAIAPIAKVPIVNEELASITNIFGGGEVLES